MGAIADAMVAYAQPLLDETDGSLEEMQRALSLSQLCWNLAILPKEQQEQMLWEMRAQAGLNDEEFDDFRRSILVPMIKRHETIFGRRLRIPDPPAVEKYPGTEPYAPCPCNSGRKYKFCCRPRAR